MADQMTTAELAAVSDRIVGDVPEPSIEGLHERLAAGSLARAIAAGDPGQVRGLLAGLRNGTTPWQVEPWRLLAELAEIQIRQQPPA